MSLSDFLKNCQDYIGHSSHTPLNRFQSPAQLKDSLKLYLSEGPTSKDEIDRFIEIFLNHSVNTSSKKYMNQLWSKVDMPSMIGEIITALNNTSMYTFEVAPVLTLMEIEMIRSLSQFIWPNQTADGIMTSGGSASNLQALLLARNQACTHSKQTGLTRYQGPTPVILCASNAHYSLKRSANILGIGHNSLIEIPCNSIGQINSKDLMKCIDQQRKLDKEPIAFVSTAGTTVEGSFDAIEELGIICQKENIWFHIDGAYGASVLVSDHHRSLMKGAEYCHSLSWDFHKMMGVNLPCAFLFTREKGLLKETLLTGNDHYIYHDDISPDLGPKSIQCGRRPDILKLWLTWMSHGRQGLGQRVDQLFKIAQDFAQLILDHPLFELVYPPQSINVCFRVVGADASEIRQKMINEGTMMINFSSNDNGPFFRAAITRPDLTIDDLKQILVDILEAKNALS